MRIARLTCENFACAGVTIDKLTLEENILLVVTFSPIQNMQNTYLCPLFYWNQATIHKTKTGGMKLKFRYFLLFMNSLSFEVLFRKLASYTGSKILPHGQARSSHWHHVPVLFMFSQYKLQIPVNIWRTIKLNLINVNGASSCLKVSPYVFIEID